MNRTFSLDCEKLWGMPPRVKDQYIKDNVRHASETLQSICDGWDEMGDPLYLAFVSSSVPIENESPIDDRCFSILRSRGYGKYLNTEFLYFENLDRILKKNIFFGLHGFSHDLYSEMSTHDLEGEIRLIKSYIDRCEGFDQIFVYPKNLADTVSIKKYAKWFSKVRVNSRSWLYRSSGNGPNKIKRLLRYLDSFIPIYEFFCNKKPEHDLENSTVGTHFYRANLSLPLLLVHYVRLRVGVFLMYCLGRDVHIWSHPHNFSNNSLAVKLFCRLQKKRLR